MRAPDNADIKTAGSQALFDALGTKLDLDLRGTSLPPHLQEMLLSRKVREEGA